MNRTVLRAALLCAGLGALVSAGLPAVSASASGAMVSQISTLSIDSANPAVIDIGTINSQFSSITVAATGTTTWCNDDPNPACTSDPGGHNNYGLMPSPDGTAPDLPTGALVAKVGLNGTWFIVGDSHTVTSTVPADVYVAYNDNVFVDNSGSYALTITRVKPAS